MFSNKGTLNQFKQARKRVPNRRGSSPTQLICCLCQGYSLDVWKMVHFGWLNWIQCWFALLTLARHCKATIEQQARIKCFNILSCILSACVGRVCACVRFKKIASNLNCQLQRFHDLCVCRSLCNLFWLGAHCCCCQITANTDIFGLGPLGYCFDSVCSGPSWFRALMAVVVWNVAKHIKRLCLFVHDPLQPTDRPTTIREPSISYHGFKQNLIKKHYHFHISRAQGRGVEYGRGGGVVVVWGTCFGKQHRQMEQTNKHFTVTNGLQSSSHFFLGLHYSWNAWTGRLTKWERAIIMP